MPASFAASPVANEAFTSGSFTRDAEILEYSKAADPIASGATPKIGIRAFSSDLYASGATRLIPLDLSDELRTGYAATSPSLLGNFVRIRAGETLATSPNASSEFYYVIRGAGSTRTASGTMVWSQGDIFALPGIEAVHCADSDAAFYMVNDSPLLAYLGAQKFHSRFEPILFPKESILAELEEAKNDPAAPTRSRVSVLLANRRFPQTQTITHTLWSMFGVISPGARQLPHRHQSVALDFVVKAQPGVYTQLGVELGADGKIKDPIRVDWVSGEAFVTPPSYWHEHVNESDSEAFVMPIQDAGLHTYLRTLDIQFYLED